MNVDVPDSAKEDYQAGATPTPIVLEGTQNIAKFNRQVADKVRIFVALYRIPTNGVDLVLTANFPLMTEKGPSVPEESMEVARHLFVSAAKSLKIVDFGLFA